MTCTHADQAARPLGLGFQYDNLVIEEAAQIMEVETFIPMVLQAVDAATGKSRLKRVVLIGDHHQLRPSSSTRRSKSTRASTSRCSRASSVWGCPPLSSTRRACARRSPTCIVGGTPVSATSAVATDKFAACVPGMARPFQLVNVVALRASASRVAPALHSEPRRSRVRRRRFMYLRLVGVPATKISIITTYNGQRDLIADIVQQRCASSALYGTPAKIATTDKFQGQQNDIILLSLVRTKAVGHIRDVRRLVVSVSRARLGLYLVGAKELYESVVELRPPVSQLLALPDALEVVPDERYGATARAADDVAPAGAVAIPGLAEMGELVARMAELVALEAQQRADEYGGGEYGGGGDAPSAPPADAGGAARRPVGGATWTCRR